MRERYKCDLQPLLKNLRIYGLNGLDTYVYLQPLIEELKDFSYASNFIMNHKNEFLANFRLEHYSVLGMSMLHW